VLRETLPVWRRPGLPPAEHVAVDACIAAWMATPAGSEDLALPALSGWLTYTCGVLRGSCSALSLLWYSLSPAQRSVVLSGRHSVGSSSSYDSGNGE